MQPINKSMYGTVKHTIRKHIEWPTVWYMNQDHSMNVCKDVVKGKGEKWVKGHKVTPRY